MTRSERIVVSPFTLPTLERVEDGLPLLFARLEFGGVVAIDEDATEDANQEAGEECVDVGHGIRLREFSEEGGELGLKFRDAFRVGLLGGLDLIGHGDKVLVRHLGVT